MTTGVGGEPKSAPLEGARTCTFRMPGSEDGPVPSVSGFDTELEVRGPFTLEQVPELVLLTDTMVGTEGLRKIAVLPIEGGDTDCQPGCIAYTRIDSPLRPGSGRLIGRAMSRDGQVICEAVRNLQVNTPPRASNLRVVPERPTVDDDIAFAVSLTDADGDVVRTEVQWTPAEGSALNDPELGHLSTRHGDAWVLSVAPTDNLDLGEPLVLELLFPTPEGVTDGPCPAGSVLRGRAPPFGTGTTCEGKNPAGGFVKHGTERTWWHPKKGIDKSRVDWRDGKKHGLWVTWHENAIKASETTWQDGKLHGQAQAWHEDGSRQADYSFVAGRKEGKETNWFQDGTRRYEMDAFVTGNKHGVETHWYHSGELAGRCEWQNGRRHGLCQRWGPDNAIEEEIRYQEGQRHGPWARWHLTTHKAEEGEYEMGQPTGTWSRWTEDGDLIDRKKMP